jgi:hypothetical protein
MLHRSHQVYKHVIDDGYHGAGVKGNTTIELICEGQDEQAFMNELTNAFAQGFGETVM